MRPGYEIEEDDEGKWLVVSGDWSAKTASALGRNGLDGLRLNYMKGFRERNLDFLRGLPVRQLDLVARTIDDLEPIYSLDATLVNLSLVVGSNARCDVARLPRLTRLSAEWVQVAATISSAHNLTDLYIGAYDGRDFSDLSALHQLQVLRMKDRPYLESLDGLSAFPALRRLEVAGAKRLSDFQALRTEASNLDWLSLQGCTKLTSLEVVSELAALTWLNVSECGPVDSLGPIAGLSNLESVLLYGSTNIQDNDLSPLLALPKLKLQALQSRKSYRPSASEIDSTLAARKSH